MKSTRRVSDPLLRISISNDAMALSGVAITEVNPELLHILPGAVSVTAGRHQILIQFDSTLAAREVKSASASIKLVKGTKEVRFGDALYGVARFLLSDCSARAGRIAADAAAFIGPLGSAVLVVGNGKTNLACCAADAGSTILADDVVELSMVDGEIIAAGYAGGTVRSRSGRAANLGTPQRRSSVVSSTIIVLPAFSGVAELLETDPIDLSSHWWQALAGRILNVRSFPEVFQSPYLGQLSRSTTAALTAVHSALLRLPSKMILGDPNEAMLRSALEPGD